MTSGLAARLAPLSLVLFVAAIGVYALLARQSLNAAQISVLVILTPVLVLLVHEGLHGVGFLVFGGRPKFGAGIKGGVPYLFATCPGRRFTWGRTLVIGALPLVLIDLAALALAGYSPLVIPAMLAFAFNTAGAVADLWLIAVILQTPRSALFEDSDEPAMIAWAGPGAKRPAHQPRGLNPRGFESMVMWVSLASVLFMASFLVIGIAEIALARSFSNGTLAVGNIELARVTTAGGRVSGRANLSALIVLAMLLAAPLTWAARRRTRP
jgi:hypothetical protein